MNKPIDEEKITQLLNDFSKLPFKKIENPTFLEIIKQSDRETVWSNILAFYFNPQKKHGLGTLMLKSFFEALGENVEIKNFRTIKVTPEFPTENHKRIDLVIEADNFVIGIENKVNSGIYNDFEEYGKTIETVAKDRKKYKVILSKNHHHDERGFVNLSYDSFIKSIKRNLRNNEAKADDEYLIFLNNFLKNIENTIKFKEMIENEKSLEYFQNNYDAIQQLTVKFLKFKDEARIKFGEIHSVINLVKLDTDFKKKFGIEASIHKGGIWDQEDDNRFPIFSIFIENSKKIEYFVYVEAQMRFIYCYGNSDDESCKEILLKLKNFELHIEFPEGTREAAQKIVNQIEKIIDTVFVE
jgi:hypothetical protein